MWWEVVKLMPVLKPPTIKIKTPLEEGKCNTQLRQGAEYIKSIIPQIRTELDAFVKKYQKLTYPKNYGESYIGPLEFREKKMTMVWSTITDSGIRFESNYPFLPGITFTSDYSPIDEQKACKLLEMYNSSKANEVNGINEHSEDSYSSGISKEMFEAHRELDRMAHYHNRTLGNNAEVFIAILTTGGHPFHWEVPREYDEIKNAFNEMVKPYLDKFDNVLRY